MKKLFYTLLAIILPLSVFAQKHHEMSEEDKEKIKAIQVAFLTDRLNLSSEQAKDFWPIFYEYSDKKANLRDEMKNKNDSFRTLSDQELNTALDAYLELHQKEIDLDKAYKDKFLAVINHRQLAELYAAEHRLKRIILKEFRKRRQESREEIEKQRRQENR